MHVPLPGLSSAFGSFSEAISVRSGALGGQYISITKKSPTAILQPETVTSLKMSGSNAVKEPYSAG